MRQPILLRRTPQSGFALVAALALAGAAGWATGDETAPAAGAAAPSATSPAAAAATPPAAPTTAPVYRLRLDSIIHPVAVDFIRDGVKAADEAGATVLIVELSTPGGLLPSTREIVTALLGAATPVVVYVAPSGSQAASAGFFILMAADLAAMAPGTNTGAAHPVGGQGEDIAGKMGEKVEQDAAAMIRSLAQRRGRDPAVAEKAVLESTSYSAEEALAAGLVDLVTPSLPALLVALDGREVEKNGRTLTLATAAAPVEEVEQPALRRALGMIAHPNVAAILLVLGMLGMYFELMNPGAVLPGVVGAICLVLAFFALSVLPFNAAGLALMLLAVIFFIAEIKVTSFGLLTVAGAISLVLGAMLLFKSPEPALRVSLGVIVPMAVFAVLVAGFLATLVVRSRRTRVHTGSEGLVAATGTAFSDLAPRGKVTVQGELWNAVSERPVAAGAAVEVLAVEEGMLLRVRPAGPQEVR